MKKQHETYNKPKKEIKPEKDLIAQPWFKVALGLGVIGSLLSSKVAAVFGNTLAAWLVFKAHKGWSTDHLNKMIAETNDRLETLMAKDESELTDDEKVKKQYLINLEAMMKADEKNVVFGSYLLGFTTFVNPILGALFLGGAAIARKAEYNKHMVELDRTIESLLKKEEEAEMFFSVDGQQPQAGAA